MLHEILSPKKGKKKKVCLKNMNGKSQRLNRKEATKYKNNFFRVVMAFSPSSCEAEAH